MKPQVSILLLTLNPGKWLLPLLDRLFAQDFPQASEVVVVDSGSTDGSAAVAQTYPVPSQHRLRWHTIAQSEFGHGRTRNLAASLAQGDWLVYLSQDALPLDNTWLAQLTAPLTDSHVAGTTGRQLPHADTPWTQRYFLEHTYPAQSRRLRLQPGQRVTLQSVFFSNVNSCIRKAVWQHIPFDETVVMSEDQAWARATLTAGYDLVYLADAAVYHAHAYSLQAALQRNFDSGYSLRGIVQDSFLATAFGGLRYVAAEMVWVGQRVGWQLTPSILLFESVRMAGFSLGRHADRLPLSWCTRLSQQPGYWKRMKDEG